MKQGQKTHLNELFEAMLDKANIKIKGIESLDLVIQHINMDGDCTIFDNNSSEILMYDVSPDQIKII